jgi:small-conductance mechanosensitive channel
MSAMRQILQDPFELLVPLALLAGTVIAGLILRRILFRVFQKWAGNADGHLAILVRESLSGPLVLWSIMLGLHLATQYSEIPARYLKHAPAALAALWILSVTLAMSHLAGNIVRFYGGRVTGAQSVTTLTQKLAQLAVVAIGIAWLLRVVFNLSLTPVLTTLGVGGIAVALALQDTLSNLFAGFYVSISGLIRLGDYIKLNSGEEGYVLDINWRSTTMRGVNNGLIIVPNSKLGQAIYTNYHLEDPRIGVSVTFGVGPESDIDRVTEVLLDEAKSAAAEVPGILEDPPPSILFNPGPGDWNLGFQVQFSIRQFQDQNTSLSEMRRRIYKRLLKEGISMPFPTRTVIVQNADARTGTPDSAQ